MSIAEILAKNRFQWDREKGALEAAVTELSQSAGFTLPESYLEFLRLCNGGYGELPVDPLWFVIWPAEKVIEANRDLQVAIYASGFFGFGGNGGGEMLAFDLTKPVSSAVFSLPMIGMERGTEILVAPDFETFVSYLGMPGPDDDED
ncbi:MAG: SMI1/KNR4 family protein [Cyanobacteria bacterium SZAS LIN-3]|nr:SMI1/KNR4 family protein [Cyanobacteria bacterium SZAS LIN-3]